MAQNLKSQFNHSDLLYLIIDLDNLFDFDHQDKQILFNSNHILNFISELVKSIY